MGISYFPTAAEGVLPVLLINTLLSVALLKNVVQLKLLQIMGSNENSPEIEEILPNEGFEGDEEVSELSCKHFFHKRCLEKWLDHKHSTCPLCRSSL
ncbi:zinc finger protein [Macleaya cordata]|uniref:Zinc finger protein n=1 Tax=Macleaya cordata TaxID=56857 RepID=A0A200RDP6_MACCD|nr:zinc finger protein [Macleaya cordata]